MYDERTPPLVPGINAQPLKPTIGPGVWRTSNKKPPTIGGARQRVGSFSGNASAELCPPSKAVAVKLPPPHQPKAKKRKVKTPKWYRDAQAAMA